MPTTRPQRTGRLGGLANEPGEEPRATVVACPGPEFAAAARQWQGIPGIERAGNGRLWAAWYTGGAGEGPGNHVVLVTSDDDGHSWGEPVLAVVPPPGGRCFDPCLWHDPDGRLWLFWAQCGGDEWFDGRGGVWAVHTDGSAAASPRWGKARRLANGVMMNKPTVLSSGEWLLPIALWEAARKRHPELAAECRPAVYATTDRGATFARLGGPEVADRVFDEHMVVERRDGSLWMLIRVREGIAESESHDGGRTWSAGRRAALPGPGSRFFLRRLRSGRLLLVNHEPVPETPALRARLCAWLSEDDGATWPWRLSLDTRPGVSYPDGIETDTGLLYVIYDYNRGDVYALGRDREILLAVFTEEDVMTGRVSDPRARSRAVVNRVP
ncbi:MAG: Glycosyl hydrolases family 43 [Lentisphaerae bacterium ADurb.BinA184]|nr:MAG: Glycosyl hydrolases family 43 [Lentisphaerae bacterium ADurb.BinA184]